MVEADVPFAVPTQDSYFVDREGLFLLLMAVVTLSLLPISKLISLAFATFLIHLLHSFNPPFHQYRFRAYHGG